VSEIFGGLAGLAIGVVAVLLTKPRRAKPTYLAPIVNPRPPSNAMWPLLDGGNWEGGTTDAAGNMWVHVPNVGWQKSRPNPFLRQES
jgi:hypothetical protein